MTSEAALAADSPEMAQKEAKGRNLKHAFVYLEKPATSLRFAMLTLLLSMHCVASLPPANADQTYRPLAAMARRINDYVAPIVADHDFGGAILVAQRGKVLFKKAYGMADYARSISNSPNTEFGIGSISKQFTAAGLLILQDEGKLSINDPLSKFVPDFPHGSEITLKMMLTHRSGICRDLPDPEHNYGIRFTPEELVALIAQQPLSFLPGTKQSYSNMAYGVLGYVIEKVSGESYGQFLKEKIFEPLKMDHTGVQDEQDLNPKLAIGYNPWINSQRLGPNPPHSDSNAIGSGSLFSTVDDLYKWDRSFQGDQILSPTAKKMMLDPSDGLGVDVEKVFGRTLVTHNGVYKGYTGFVERYVEDDISIIYLGNVETGASITPLETSVRAIVFNQPYKPAEVPVVQIPSSVPPSDLSGVYNVFPGLDLFVQVHGNYLLLGAGDGYFPLEPRADGSYFYRLKYSTVKFNRDAAGQVVSLGWSQEGSSFTCPKKTAK